MKNKVLKISAFCIIPFFLILQLFVNLGTFKAAIFTCLCIEIILTLYMLYSNTKISPLKLIISLYILVSFFILNFLTDFIVSNNVFGKRYLLLDNFLQEYDNIIKYTFTSEFFIAVLICFITITLWIFTLYILTMVSTNHTYSFARMILQGLSTLIVILTYKCIAQIIFSNHVINYNSQKINEFISFNTNFDHLFYYLFSTISLYVTLFLYSPHIKKEKQLNK